MSISAFKEAVELAQEFNEPCWIIFHKYWIAEIMFYLQHDYQGTLDYAIRLAAEARKDLYLECPVRSRIFFVLANIYYLIDFFGYEQEVMELMDYIEEEIVMDHDTHLRVQHMRAQADFDNEKYDASEEKTHHMLSQSLGNNFRQRSGYYMLRAIAYAKGDIPLAHRYTEVSERHARFIQIQRSIAEGKLCQAVYKKRMGNDTQAREDYFAGLGHYEQYHLPREVAYHDLCAEYLELVGSKDEALTLRRDLIDIVMSKASIYNQSLAHQQYLRLLGRLGLPMGDALKEAKALANSMKKPQHYLEKIAEIEGGNYYEFAWQAES
jgi:ATP/maltotriose-dependent transcriptional regulator MalT